MIYKELALPFYGGIFDRNKFVKCSGTLSLLPIKEIYTYCASKIILSMKKGFCSDNNVNVETFISNNKLNNIDFYRCIESDMQMKITLHPAAPIPPIHQSLKRAKEEFHEIREKLECNRKALSEEIYLQIKRSLLDFATNKEIGPKYASLLIKNFENKDLLSVLISYIYECRQMITFENYELKFFEDDFLNKLWILVECNSISKKRKYNDCVISINSFCSHLLRKGVYEEMEIFLSDLLERIEKLHQDLFVPLNRILDNLIETSDLNLTYLLNEFDNNSISYEDLKLFGDDFINSINSEIISTELVKTVIEKINSSEKENQIANEINDFFIMYFCDLK